MVHKVLNLPNAGVLDYIFLLQLPPGTFKPTLPIWPVAPGRFSNSLIFTIILRLRLGTWITAGSVRQARARPRCGCEQGRDGSRSVGMCGEGSQPLGLPELPPKRCGAAAEGERVIPAAPGPCGGRAAPGGSSAPGMRGRAPALRGCPRGKQRTGRGPPGGSLNGKTFLEWKASPRSNTFRAWLEWCWLCGNWCRKGRQSNKLMSQLRNVRLIDLLSFCL